MDGPLVVGVVKVDYFDFSRKKLKNWCELDVRVINCLQLLGFLNFFGFFPIFSPQTRLFLNQKQKKYIWVFFPLNFIHYFQLWHQK